MISNINEAESAAAQLDAAFKATGANAGITRKALDDLAVSIQRTTIYSDDLVKQAESILLTFRQVRGDAFERTIKVAADLSSRLGIDLVSAVRQVGRSINDPIQGLTLLRRSGIQFTDSQAGLIKSLVETGRAAQAQNLILTELENRYKGAAAAARNTLGGALAGLKNAFGDLFEGGDKGTSGAVKAINGLTDALSDPSFKSAVDSLISGLAKIAELAVKATTGVVSLFKSSPGLSTTQDIDKRIAETEAEIRNRSQGRQVGRAGRTTPESEDEPAKRLRGGAAANLAAFREDLEMLRGLRAELVAEESKASTEIATEAIGAIQTVEEVRTTARKKELTATEQFYADLNELTKTTTEQQVSRYHQLIEAINELERAQSISAKTAEDRRSEALDELLPEFDLEKIRGLKKEVKREVSEIGEIMKGIWQGVGQSIQSTLSDALYEWKLSFKSLLDITRRALADITSAIITSGISKALKAALSGASSGSSSSGGFWAGVLKAIGFAAGGGSQSGPRVVGEDGPELDMGNGRIYNQRQMAFAGMGSTVTFSPVTNISLIERDNPEKTKQEIFRTVAIQNSKQQAEFIRTLQRSGIEVKG